MHTCLQSKALIRTTIPVLNTPALAMNAVPDALTPGIHAVIYASILATDAFTDGYTSVISERQSTSHAMIPTAN